MDDDEHLDEYIVSGEETDNRELQRHTYNNEIVRWWRDTYPARPHSPRTFTDRIQMENRVEGERPNGKLYERTVAPFVHYEDKT